MTRAHFRHRLLLDEGVESRNFFPQMNNLFNLRHITQDYKHVGLSDSDVYKIAIKEKRVVITYNVKDFKPLAKMSDSSGVIGLTGNLSPEQIDKKLTALLRNKSARQLYKRFTPVSE